MPEDIEYGGFWRRLGAALIDRVLFVVLLGLLQLAIYGLPSPEALAAAEDSGFGFDGLFQELVMFVVSVALWVRFTGTPGKLLLNCHVVDAESLGPVSLRQGVLRYLGYIVSALPLFAGFFWIAFDKRKQGFHDKIANTVVVLNLGYEPDDESRKSLDQLLREVR